MVILDAGLGNHLDVWAPVIERVGAFTTVCAYNRAGLGRSDFRPPPHGAPSAVDDLHALLGAAGLPPPYVVGGASFGGLDAQLFARRYPSETAGVVLVDAIAPGWDPQLEAILTPAQVADRRAIPNNEDLTNEDIRASETAVGEGPPFPPVPLVVLHHGIPFPGGPDWPTDRVEALWLRLQQGLAAMSPTSTLLLATTSGHHIHEDQPDLVADAIHALVDPSRWPPVAADRPAFGDGAPALAPGTVKELLAWGSPDGIRLSDADGGHARLVVPNGDGATVGEPSLDAGGTRIAYARRLSEPAASGPRQDSKSEVWVADVATGRAHQVTDDGAIPQLSPDGRSVVFSRRGHEYLVAAGGGTPRDLGEGGCAVWSPDGRRLAMCTNDDRAFVLRLADGTRTTISAGPGPDEPTAWSPEGSTIALVSTRDGDGEVYLVGADGTGERRLTDAPGTQAAAPWLAEGLLVTSSLPDADASDWFLVDPTTGAATAIAWMHGVPNPIAAASAP